MSAIARTALVVSPTLVYVAIAERERFDQIALEETDHTTLVDPRPVLSKTLEANGVLVIFQHWIAS